VAGQRRRSRGGILGLRRSHVHTVGRSASARSIGGLGRSRMPGAGCGARVRPRRSPLVKCEDARARPGSVAH
jgi:hypothetical protein